LTRNQQLFFAIYAAFITSDEDGNELIEGMAGLWCTSLGWGEERLVQAAAKWVD
jgi:adenosylmethionine-8-amino-7-oxononanoate aminotransferase